MQRVLCGIALVAMLIMAGCGGGGGGVAQLGQPQMLSLPSEMVGTYNVQGLGLPNDELGVETSGDVFVQADAPANARMVSASHVRIGSCSRDGALSLSGAWSVGGANYSITASGRVRAESRSLSLQATVLEDSNVLHRDAAVTGELVQVLNPPAPPPPPVIPDPSPDMPPPPPVMSGTPEAPPSPPQWDWTVSADQPPPPPVL